MASIRKEIEIAVAPQKLWEALRDVGALHTRLVRGFVTDCRMALGTDVHAQAPRVCRVAALRQKAPQRPGTAVASNESWQYQHRVTIAFGRAIQQGTGKRQCRPLEQRAPFHRQQQA